MENHIYCNYHAKSCLNAVKIELNSYEKKKSLDTPYKKVLYIQISNVMRHDISGKYFFLYFFFFILNERPVSGIYSLNSYLAASADIAIVTKFPHPTFTAGKAAYYSISLFVAYCF